jgi:hypothetical protein
MGLGMSFALASWSVVGDASTTVGLGWRQFVESGKRLFLVGSAIGAIFVAIIVRYRRVDRLAMHAALSGVVFGSIVSAIKWGSMLWMYRLPVLATLMLAGGAGWLMGCALERVCAASKSRDPVTDVS